MDANDTPWSLRWISRFSEGGAPLEFELKSKITVRDFNEGGAYTMFLVAPPSMVLGIL